MSVAKCYRDTLNEALMIHFAQASGLTNEAKYAWDRFYHRYGSGSYALMNVFQL